MKTLIIISHPDVAGSSTQQFFMAAAPKRDSITLHHLERVYPDGNINKEKEQKLLEAHDRIIFQFPLYWYSSPALLKQWQDVVLDEKKIAKWSGKEFGLVVMVGVGEKEYRTGGREAFTLDEILRPYQVVANKFDWTYLPIFPVYQFGYKSEQEKQQLLIAYQQYLMLGNKDSLTERTDWFKEELSLLMAHKKNDSDQRKLLDLQEALLNNQDEIEQLRLTMAQLD